MANYIYRNGKQGTGAVIIALTVRQLYIPHRMGLTQDILRRDSLPSAGMIL